VAQLATYSGTKVVVSLRIEGLGCEFDESPSSGKVKNEWNYTSTPPHTFKE